jgi:hypothetical protein
LRAILESIQDLVTARGFGSDAALCDWKNGIINLSTLFTCHGRSEDEIWRVITEPNLCSLCVIPDGVSGLKRSVLNYETVDNMAVYKYATTKDCFRVTRRVFWSLDHNDNSELPNSNYPGWATLCHTSYCWDHPHYFMYDITRHMYIFNDLGNLNRLELDILIECDKLQNKMKVKDGTIRLKSIYRFPRPVAKVKKIVRPLVWTRMCATLFSLCMGTCFETMDQIVSFWTNNNEETSFESKLLNETLLFDSSVGVEINGQQEFFKYEFADILRFEQDDDDPDISPFDVTF